MILFVGNPNAGGSTVPKAHKGYSEKKMKSFFYLILGFGYKNTYNYQDAIIRHLREKTQIKISTTLVFLYVYLLALSGICSKWRLPGVVSSSGFSKQLFLMTDSSKSPLTSD